MKSSWTFTSYPVFSSCIVVDNKSYLKGIDVFMKIITLLLMNTFSFFGCCGDGGGGGFYLRM
jgi:hypothetical protein